MEIYLKKPMTRVRNAQDDPTRKLSARRVERLFLQMQLDLPIVKEQVLLPLFVWKRKFLPEIEFSLNSSILKYIFCIARVSVELTS